MNDEERRGALIALGRSMSAADLSILEAALAELNLNQAVKLTTTAASKNDVLWSEMTALGWLTEEAPLELVPGSKLYEIPASSKTLIAQFLADLDKNAAMTRITNELRNDIPYRLIGAVRAVEGTPADLAILVAGIVEMTMRRALKPELHDEFLREVAKVAEGMRSV
jgi:hypothetical protein